MRNYSGMGRAQRPCGCAGGEPASAETEFPVAMAYVPWQHFSTVYEPDRALETGTIFPELNLPFYGGRGTARR